MTEDENLEIQYEMMDINMRLDFIQVRLCDDISENDRKKYYQEFHRLERKYKNLQSQLTSDFVRRIK